MLLFSRGDSVDHRRMFLALLCLQLSNSARTKKAGRFWMSSEKLTSQDREETAHEENAVSSRVWLGDQSGHSRLEKVLDRYGNSSGEVCHIGVTIA